MKIAEWSQVHAISKFQEIVDPLSFWNGRHRQTRVRLRLGSRAILR